MFLKYITMHFYTCILTIGDYLDVKEAVLCYDLINILINFE